MQAADVLQFAFEDWPGGLPASRTLDELHADPEFRAEAQGAVVAAVRPKAAISEAAE